MKIHDVNFENIISKKSSNPGYFLCDKDSPCYDINLTNVNIESSNDWKCKAV